MISPSSSAARVECISRPLGITAISVFFGFGAVMSGLTALMLVFPGSVVEPLWKLNPSAQHGFAVMGGWAIPLMLVVCLACAIAARGMCRRTRLGYWTAVVILVVNLLGDSANAVLLHDWRTVIGLPIGGAMLWYLIRKRHLLDFS